MRAIIAIIKYGLVTLVVFAIVKIGHSMITEKKEFTVDNIKGEIKSLIIGTQEKIIETDKGHLYKNISFRIVEGEENKYIFQAKTEKKYETCGYKIRHTAEQRPGKISIKFFEIETPTKNSTCREGENPAVMTTEIELEEVFPNELMLSRNLLMDKYLVTLEKDEIRITPSLGIFSKPY